MKASIEAAFAASLISTAEGLLITPPSMKRAMDWDDIGCVIDLTLWTN